MASKAEKGWEGSPLGPAVGRVIGPTKPDAFFKAPDQCSRSSAKEVTSIVHSQESSKLKSPSISARCKARSWPPSLKVSSSASKHNLDGGGSTEANLAIFQGRPVSNKGVLPPILETSQVFTEETEGAMGFSRCSLANKVCPPFLASSEQGHPLAGAFAPKSLPISSVFAVHLFWCQPFFYPMESVFPSQGVPFSNPPSVKLSRRVGVSCFEGVAFPVEASNRNFIDCLVLKESLSNTKELCISGKASSPEPEPPTLPLEDLKLEYKRIRFQEENEDCQKVFKFSKSRYCDASGNKERNLGLEFKCTEKVLRSFSVTVKLNSRGDFNVIRRISEKLGDSRLTFNMSLQEALPRWTSDHSPICLETNPLKWGPTPFKFENMWLLHPEFKEKFSDWWQECTVEGWEGRIDLIEQEENLNLDLVSERTLRRRELEDLLLKEEVHWRQKSRVKWIKEGDCNSKFFHRMANGRRSGKFIKSLISERGVTLSNIEVISEEIVNFFGKLYSKLEGASRRVEGVDWVSIHGESTIWLDRPFSEEEVRMAVFQLNKEKAPSPDGFTIAVYQECWDVIKEDLMRVFLEFHTNGIINKSTNATFIAMVPKKSQTFKISNYRPISLVTSLYKIIAKVLSARLRKVLHETISGSQRAFVEGRHILDAVMIANEVVDEKRRSGEEGVVFKIALEKAYDHVDWGFLDHVLEINGNAKSWVKASKGLRQGDPLSPFLFTLVVDVLNDTIFFSKASLEHLQNLKIIFLVFGQVSGLKINLEKSTISGLPLGGNPKTIGFWDPVVERISRSYFLSLFKISASIASKIEKLQRDFLWSGAGEGKKDHLIRWDVVSRPKELGGLGFGKTCLRNIALLGKWLWRFPRERSGLWHKVIASIYGTHPNGWDADMVVRWSHRCPWKAIAQVFQDFSPFVSLVVGMGRESVLGKIFGGFLWSSKAPSKVKAFAWLVAYGKLLLLRLGELIKRQDTLANHLLYFVMDDDIILIGDFAEDMSKLKRLQAKEFEIKYLGNLKYLLGMEVARSQKGISISQHEYVLNLLKETGMLWEDTPMDLTITLGIKDDSAPVDKVARSNAETKFRGMAHGICEGIWPKRLLSELLISIEGPMNLLCDNQAAISITKNPVHHDQTKHVKIDHHFIKEKIDSEITALLHTPTRHQILDILTKALPWTNLKI
ncbi:Transposon TX1 uncharacterized 149 kDa protein [Vitis vinifera]|uniref:Transposon TX1 uncharacterized 149 kDa protein n=1 Tax=Vitis vinifera TaxID=29760 RepID=A0A438DI96_VITVI|nr:Transposon TX1 uncharacterized 149 kDa protein [Vitis vinifera]